jgi:hypothetical protein
MSVIAPDDLLTRTYLTELDETGQRFRAKIVENLSKKDWNSIQTTSSSLYGSKELIASTS